MATTALDQFIDKWAPKEYLQRQQFMKDAAALAKSEKPSELSVEEIVKRTLEAQRNLLAEPPMPAITPVKKGK